MSSFLPDQARTELPTQTTYAVGRPVLNNTAAILMAGIIPLTVLAMITFAISRGAAHLIVWLLTALCLALVLVTLPNPRFYEWDADHDRLPFGEPIRWFNNALRIITSAFMILDIFTRSRGSANGHNRIFIVPISMGGIVLTLMVTGGLATPEGKVLVSVWLGILAVGAIRSTLNVLRWLPQNWLSDAWTPSGVKTRTR